MDDYISFCISQAIDLVAVVLIMIVTLAVIGVITIAALKAFVAIIKIFIGPKEWEKIKHGHKVGGGNDQKRD